MKSVCFIVGAQRSGTTWIQRLLQSHPAICGGEESHFFTIFGASLRQVDKMASQDPKRRIGPLAYTDWTTFEQSLRDLWMSIFGELYASNKDALVHLEKTPDHSLYLDEITHLFPEAKIIFVTRDSRAVASSIMHAGTTWGRYWAPDNAKDAAIQWLRFSSTVRKWRDDHPHHPLMTVRYEDIVKNTPEILAGMLDFLLPDGVSRDTNDTYRRFAMSQEKRSDPEGFNRGRGTDGWRHELSLRERLLIWHYTRHEMRIQGYDIRPL